MGELRIGVNILLLRGVMPALPADAHDAAEAMLQAVARHFAGRLRDAPTMPVSVLRERGSAAMAATAAAMPGAAAQTAWLMLAGMQRSLVGSTAWPGIAEASHAR
jgi:NaMN:DMB phosphoribosyltransferase